MHKSIIERMWDETKQVGECFVWTGSLTHDGYGTIRYQYKLVRVHRLAAHLFRGMSLHSSDLTLHKSNCEFRSCWNPDHTYEGTYSDNLKDSYKDKTRFSIKRQD